MPEFQQSGSALTKTRRGRRQLGGASRSVSSGDLRARRWARLELLHWDGAPLGRETRSGFRVRGDGSRIMNASSSYSSSRVF